MGERCSICGESSFSPLGGNLREARCRRCGASKRNSDVARALVELSGVQDAEHRCLADAVPVLKGLSILETQASGPIHDQLSRLPGYICSEYMEGVPTGTYRAGIRCEDLAHLSFPDNSFDLVITQDVLEHVADPFAAFRELRRVLKPGGVHVFTVPYHPRQTTRRRALSSAKGIINLLPPVYHGDPLRPSGCLVYTDFGADLEAKLAQMGFATQILELGSWYTPEDVTWIDGAEQYDAYKAAADAGNALGYFRYNSYVFVSKNVKMAPTGERFIPDTLGEIAYEHMHRYFAAGELVAGKVVLDIASGEGYGSALLARSAARVIGVDISEDAVSHARQRYAHVANVEYRHGRCEAIPCEDASIDVVVSFETIEHIADHETFLDEVLRVLREDGILVLSSPNKQTYTDEGGTNNPYHVRELYLPELERLLRARFAVVQMYGQRLTFSSYLWPLSADTGNGGCAFTHYSEIGIGPRRPQPPFEATYFFAICSRKSMTLPIAASLYTDRKDFLRNDYHHRGQSVVLLSRHLKDAHALIASLQTELREARRLQHRLPHAKAAPVAEAANRPPLGGSPEVQVSIIIPTFNRIDLTRQCLEALHRNTPATACEVIVVDNGSTDGTRKLLQREQERGNLRAILSEENMGFAKACNLGASQANGKYLLFLNNDTVPLPGWLDALLATAEADPTVGAVGSKLLFPDRTIQHAGVIVVQNKREPEPLVLVHVHYRKPSDYRPANRPFLYQALTGACLLIRRGAFEEAGGYDEGFWNGYEDVDLCFRLQEQGWRLVYQPESVVIHAESQSGPMRFARTRENVKRLQAKWLDKIAPDYIVDEDGRVVEPETKRARPYQASGLGSADRPTQPAIEGPLVSVIILTRNQLAHTKACLQSIEQNTPLPYELIVVDNGSSDGTIPYLRQYALAHANTQVIANASNRGFAAGNNQGLALASGRHVLLLNNDTVVTAGWLERLLAVFEQHPEVGLVGPMSNYVSGPQLIPAVPYRSAAELDAFAARWATEHAGESVPVTRLVGFCLLLRREVIERIGGLDERFGTGNFEDDDFCLRAARAGFEARIACDVLVHHAGSQTFKGEKLDYRQCMQHNWELFKAKWGIPGDVPLEQGYRPPLELVDPEGAFIALPNLAASHELAPEGRWWQERPGQEEQASASVDAARGPETDAESRLRQVLEQSNAAVANGQLHVAASALQDFIRELPDVAGAQAALGAVLLAQGKPGQAVPHLKRACELAPGDVNLRNQLGVALFQTGDSEAAGEAFLAALQLAPTDVDALLNAVEVYRSQGRYEEATEYLKQATAVAPHDPNVLLALGSIGLELGDTDAGRVALARLRDIDPAHPFVRDLQEALIG